MVWWKTRTRHKFPWNFVATLQQDDGGSWWECAHCWTLSSFFSSVVVVVVAIAASSSPSSSSVVRFVPTNFCVRASEMIVTFFFSIVINDWPFVGWWSPSSDDHDWFQCGVCPKSPVVFAAVVAVTNVHVTPMSEGFFIWTTIQQHLWTFWRFYIVLCLILKKNIYPWSVLILEWPFYATFLFLDHLFLLTTWLSQILKKKIWFKFEAAKQNPLVLLFFSALEVVSAWAWSSKPTSFLPHFSWPSLFFCSYSSFSSSSFFLLWWSFLSNELSRRWSNNQFWTISCRLLLLRSRFDQRSFVNRSHRLVVKSSCPCRRNLWTTMSNTRWPQMRTALTPVWETLKWTRICPIPDSRPCLCGIFVKHPDQEVGASSW